MSKTANDFQQSAEKRGEFRWNTEACPVCFLPKGYAFKPSSQQPVVFTDACACSLHDSSYPKTYQDVADHYNALTDLDKITFADKLFGFNLVG